MGTKYTLGYPGTKYTLGYPGTKYTLVYPGTYCTLGYSGTYCTLGYPGIEQYALGYPGTKPDGFGCTRVGNRVSPECVLLNTTFALFWLLLLLMLSRLILR